jgi:hypothetical protein
MAIDVLASLIEFTTPTGTFQKPIAISGKPLPTGLQIPSSQASGLEHRHFDSAQVFSLPTGYSSYVEACKQNNLC